MPLNGIPIGRIGQIQDPVVYAAEFIAEMESLVMLPGGGILASGARVGRVYPGTVLSRLTADVAGVGKSGQFIPRKSALLTVAAVDGAASIFVDNPGAFSAGDSIIVDDGSDASDAETITSVDLVTGEIVTGTTISGGTNPLPIGSKVTVAASGQATAFGLARTRVGPPVVGHPMVAQLAIVIGGIFYKSKLLGWDAAAATTLGAVDIVSAMGTLVNIKR